MTTETQVTIFTDGGCSPNPGPGGWGVVLIYKDEEKTFCGGAEETTNNRMELTAAIEALKALTRPCEVILHTDSHYVQKGMTEWLAGWKAKNWRTASKKPVKNADLWRALDAEAARHKVHWVWVEAHSGNPGNERADALSHTGREPYLKD